MTGASRRREDGPPDHVDRMVAQWSATAPGTDVRPLEVVGRLLQAADRVQRSIAASLTPLGLSYADFDVLNTLRRLDEPAGTNPTVLARSVLITSGAMTARLDRLARTELIEREPDPVDRRAVRVRLTPSGDRLAQRALAAVLEADRAFLAALDEPTRDDLARTLGRLLTAEPDRRPHPPNEA